MPIPKDGNVRRGSRPLPGRQNQQAATPAQPQKTEGAGSDPTGQQALASLNSRYSSVSRKLTLSTLAKQIEDMNGQIGSLGITLTNLRARGYRYGRGWEDQVQSLSERWATQHGETRRLLDQQVEALRVASQGVQQALQRSQHDSSWTTRAEQQLAQLEQLLSRAESDVRGSFSQINSKVTELNRDFRQATALYEALDTGKFQLYPDENGVALCKAQWEDGGEQPEGILVLTDGRLIFEQRQKKATKKILFITTGSETIQQLLFEAPLGTIEEVEASDIKGMLGIGSKELLNLRFSQPPQRLPRSITLKLLEGTRNEDWAALIRRVQSGQIEMERYDITPEQLQASAETETPVNIPSNCPACGGKLPAYAKGMRQLACPYCGTHVSLF